MSCSRIALYLLLAPLAETGDHQPLPSSVARRRKSVSARSSRTAARQPDSVRRSAILDACSTYRACATEPGASGHCFDESSLVYGCRVVHSLDELSVPRCNLVLVRTGVLKLGFWVISHGGRLADAVRVRGTYSGLALVQMDLDPHLHRGRQLRSRAAVLRRREQTRFMVCERRRSRRLPGAIRSER